MGARTHARAESNNGVRRADTPIRNLVCLAEHILFVTLKVVVIL